MSTPSMNDAARVLIRVRDMVPGATLLLCATCGDAAYPVGSTCPNTRAASHLPDERPHYGPSPLERLILGCGRPGCPVCSAPEYTIGVDPAADDIRAVTVVVPAGCACPDCRALPEPGACWHFETDDRWAPEEFVSNAVGFHYPSAQRAMWHFLFGELAYVAKCNR